MGGVLASSSLISCCYAGCWLLVAGCWLLVATLLVAGGVLQHVRPAVMYLKG